MVATTGNTVLQPPRRTGNGAEDLYALFDYVGDLHRHLIVQANIVGTIRALEARLDAIGQIAAAPAEASATYTAAELTAAFQRINAIVTQAKG